MRYAMVNHDQVSADPTVRARLAYIGWVRKNYPQLFKRAITQTPAELDGLGDQFDPNDAANFVGPPVSAAAGNNTWFNQLLSTLQNGFGQYWQYRNSRDIFDLNLARARQDLPPVTQQQMETGQNPDAWKQYAVPLGIGAALLLFAWKA